MADDSQEKENNSTSGGWKRPVKTPTVLQMEAVECGAAALAMILARYGKIVSLEELRYECGVSRDGSKASNIVKAARKYGLTATGFRKEPEELKTDPLPMIVHWNFNHFVVFEGVKGGNAYLNDPGVGPRKVSLEEFNQSFTGVALLFEKSPDFVKSGKKRSMLNALKSRMADCKMALTYVVLAGLAMVVPGLVIPVFSKIFVDEVLINSMNSWLVPLLIGMGITAILRGTLTWLQERYLLRLETKLALSTASKFFWHILHLPADFFNQRYGGEIGSRVALNDKVAQLVSGKMATTIVNCFLIIFYLGIMFCYDTVLTLVGILIVSLNIVALKYAARFRIDQNRRLLQDQGKLTGTAMGGLQAIETLKAGGMESDFFAKWAGYQTKVMNAEQGLGYTTRLVSEVPTILTALNTVAILSLGGMRVMNGDLTMGMLIAFQSLMGSVTSPINNLVGLGRDIQDAEGDMNKLDDVLNHKVDEQFSGPAVVETPDMPAKLEGYLELKNITFGYSRLAPPLLENFSISMKPGDRIALVGGSGSGKSTAAKLISGLYGPWDGEILFDGKPRTEIPRSIMTNSFAMVDQDISMFEGTIRDNLTMWDTTIPESSLIQAAKDACIHYDISARHGGYDHKLNEGGSNFSGGQRQRMEIARALTINPKILILDEATSALDPNTENIVDNSFRKRGCTCLIVAHRLSTIRDCDEIIVLEKGKVVQRGTHDEMKDVEGHYSRMIKM